MSDSGTGVAVGVSVSIVSLVLCGVGFYFWYRRRRAQGSARVLEDARRPHTMLVDPTHLAAQVTPYTPTSEVPVFTHRPGENMRVARRRSDGGWDFTDPLSPFCASPMTPPRFPYSRAESIYSLQSSAAHSTTSFIKKDKLPGELTTRGYVEYDAEGLPPSCL